MPSKKSKPSSPPPSLWKAEPTCSEAELQKIAAELAAELRPGDRVVLEGPMGAGKSTFARALLQGLGIHQPAEGSPTFAIAHEYDSHRGAVAHMDFYRLKSEEEIEETGISAYFWEREMIVITEWLSNFPEFAKAVLKDPHWRVELGFAAGGDERARDLRIERAGANAV